MDQIAQYSSETSSDDSDFEFELNFRPRSVLGDFDEELAPKPPARVFDSEYYDLPLIENLCLSDRKVDKQSLRMMGTVVNVIDFIVTIKPAEGVPYLDYDTVLFNEEAEFLGFIFEIFGLLAEPMYAIRFNNAADAQKCQFGMNIFYDPENYEFTHTSAVDTISSGLKAYDDGDQDPDFSDDEAEQEYMQKKRAKNRTVSQSSSSHSRPKNCRRSFQ